MSRLTERFGQNATTKEPVYIPAGIGTDEQVVLSEIVDKLGRLEDLEEQLMKSAEIDIDSMVGEFMHYYQLKKENRLIELPCALGDTVYKLTTKCDKHKCPPISCEQCDFDEQFVGIRKFKFSYECMYLLEKYLGDTVFLTKAEAEAKLAELKGGAE